MIGYNIGEEAPNCLQVINERVNGCNKKIQEALKLRKEVN
jgi:hypothetical protein